MCVWETFNFWKWSWASPCDTMVVPNLLFHTCILVSDSISRFNNVHYKKIRPGSTNFIKQESSQVILFLLVTGYDLPRQRCWRCPQPLSLEEYPLSLFLLPPFVLFPEDISFCFTRVRRWIPFDPKGVTQHRVVTNPESKGFNVTWPCSPPRPFLSNLEFLKWRIIFWRWGTCVVRHWIHMLQTSHPR